jgi:hypothetical protein
MIWGEHGGFLKETAAAFFKLLETKGNQEYVFPITTKSRLATNEDLIAKKDPKNWQAWVNFFTPEDAYTSFRQHVESFFRHPAMEGDYHWGFKEIRYGADDRVIEFLWKLYPEAVFVFISRNGFDNVVSQLKAFAGLGDKRMRLAFRKIYQCCKTWGAHNQSMLKWHMSGRLRSVWIRFEDLSQSIEATRPLVDLLGKVIGPQQRAVLEMESGRGSAFGENVDVGLRWQSMNWLQLLVAEMCLGRTNRALGYRSPQRVHWLSFLRHAGWGRRLDGGVELTSRTGRKSCAETLDGQLVLRP